MPLDDKIFDLKVYFEILKPSNSGSSQIEAFSIQPTWKMTQDIKTFEFEVFQSQNLEFRGFNILESASG